MNQGDDNPGTGTTKGVPQGNRAAVRVDLGRRQIKQALADKRLAGKGLVQFKDIDVFFRQPGCLEELADGIVRSQPHQLRV